MKRKDHCGFTLIEIMLVVAILGILISVVLPRLTGRTEEAKLQAARLQVETIGIALDTFEVDNGRFPSSQEGLTALWEEPADAVNWKGPYLKKPSPIDPWKNPYVYAFPGLKSNDYDLYSLGPDRRDGSEDDIGNW